VGKGRERGESLAGSIARYSSSKIYRHALGVVSALVKPKLLTPDLYGLWSLLNVIPAYTAYSHLGSGSAMLYRIPFCRGEGDEGKVREIKGTVFAAELSINIVIAAGLCLWALFGGFDPVVRYGLITMAAAVLLQFVFNYYIGLLKAYQNFRLVSSSFYLRSTLSLGALVLIWLFGIYGAYMGLVLGYALAIWYVRSQSPVGPERFFSGSLFADLVRTGFPIMLFNFITTLVRTSDKLVISAYLDRAELGFYSLAAMVFSALMQIPAAGREVMEPRLMKNLSAEGTAASLRSYLLRPVVTVSFLTPLLIGGAVFAVPAVVTLMLPRYTAGILPAQVLAVGGYFYAVALVCRGMIVAGGHQVAASGIVGLSLAVNVLLNILLIKAGYGITGVAAGTGVSFFVMAALLLLFLAKRFPGNRDDWRACLTASAGSFLAMTALIIVIGLALPLPSLPLVAAAAVRAVTFAAATALVWGLARRRMALLREDRT
jgi:O-antigen/teichoic acid export membrane protein